MQQKKINAKFFACELCVKRVGTFGVVLYRNQWPVNFILYFAELHIGSSIRYENILVGIYFLKCYIVKRILISFNCFSEILHISKFYEFHFLGFQSPSVYITIFMH